MTTVIDIGCARYGGDYSIERLIEELGLKRPDLLYGFDPNAKALADTLDPNTEYPCNIILSPFAAWTNDGMVPFHADGLNSCLTARKDMPKVPCIDLARFIATLDDADIVLKIDAEGSEYALLEHLIEHRVDALLRFAWVEWHPKAMDPRGAHRRHIEERIACELREWIW